MQVVLFISVFLIASCGLIYELIASTLSSYLLGDSVLQFSTIIGTYLFAMGVGSWLSKFFAKGLVAKFIQIELMVGVVGGFSSAILFAAFGYTESFRLILYLLVAVMGVLVGLEIPLLMRILKGRVEFRDLVANVLTFDYLGALGASLLFPLVLVPRLGLVRSALAFGLVNVLVAAWSIYLFRFQLARRWSMAATCVVATIGLSGGFLWAEHLSSLADEALFADEVVFSRVTHYQRIVLTRWKEEVRLFLNAHLQFSSRDEYRYHEALVHPGLAAVPQAREVLVLGGGDGLAVREILRYPNIQHVTLVDLDPEMTKLFRTHSKLVELNQGSLNNPKVRVVNRDAFVWLDETQQMFDFVVVDFPDPTSFALSKLYTTAFYRILEKHISAQGLFVVQSTSPLFARHSFWCVDATIKATGLKTWPYHVYVPSFGEWGYVLAGRRDFTPPRDLPGGLRFLTPDNVAPLFTFPADMASIPVDVNRLNDQVLVRYYDHEWKEIAR